MADEINVTIINWYLFMPVLIPSVETQSLFYEATQNNWKISYDEYFTERRVRSDMIVQIDIGSAQQVNSPRYLTSAHQTRTRADTPDKKNKIARFDKLYLQNFYMEIDGQLYPRDSLLINYEENDYIEQYKDFIFFSENVSENQ